MTPLRTLHRWVSRPCTREPRCSVPGKINHEDGTEGTARRIAAARPFLAAAGLDEFGITTECGFGRGSRSRCTLASPACRDHGCSKLLCASLAVAEGGSANSVWATVDSADICVGH